MTLSLTTYAISVDYIGIGAASTISFSIAAIITTIVKWSYHRQIDSVVRGILSVLLVLFGPCERI